MANQEYLIIMKILNVLVLQTMLLCGCVSQQGYLAVADFDFRKPAQIEAGVREVEAPYKNWINNTQAEIVEKEMRTESVPLAWWEFLFNMVSKLECRVTLFQIRWGGAKTINKN